MHRWSPHCALGWLQAELEEAEQEAEVREGAAGPGDREGGPILSSCPSPQFLHCRLESPPSRKPALSAWLPGVPAALLSALDTRPTVPTCNFSPNFL